MAETEKKELEEQLTNLGEIFSQCWESDEFKQAFIKDPKAIFDEYDVKYDPSKEYKVIDSPAKTIINVLPYENAKQAFELYAKKMTDLVAEVKDGEGKQILLEGWSWQFIQNTEDINYIVIPICPDSLSPEELEMVNGGCIVLGFVFAVGFLGFFAGVAFSVGAVEAVLTFSTAIFTAEGVTGSIAIVDGQAAAIVLGEDGSLYASAHDKPKKPADR